MSSLFNMNEKYIAHKFRRNWKRTATRQHSEGPPGPCCHPTRVCTSNSLSSSFLTSITDKLGGPIYPEGTEQILVVITAIHLIR